MLIPKSLRRFPERSPALVRALTGRVVLRVSFLRALRVLRVKSLARPSQNTKRPRHAEASRGRFASPCISSSPQYLPEQRDRPRISTLAEPEDRLASHERV